MTILLASVRCRWCYEIGKRLICELPRGRSYARDGSVVEVAHFNLSKLTPQTDKLLSLLEAKPVFYGKAFGPLLLKNYKAVSRYSKELLNREVVEFEPGMFESMEEVALLLDAESFFHRVIFLPLSL
jgi:hypothetical protein